ncbi:hypothetical protein FA002_02245 [Priestia megaterium]|uniref:hypothetical protein n=1 Tax=Priestia megaterium TaxID=1404 RepID=UPI0010AD0D5D|nr:hypothetical protein [Priestia megaterium]TJZ40412.1 hypothetical protein FA002_02245 [Priestia megaterium]
MTWSQFITIFLTAIVTAGFANIFGYWKDKRVASTKYIEKVFTELYLPIYKIVDQKVNPIDGFEGLDEHDIEALIAILKDKPELFDPKLEKIIYRYYEKEYANWQYGENRSFHENDTELLDYVSIAFNKTRKSLGLPYEVKYVYPIILKGKNLKKKMSRYFKIRRIVRKFMKRFKKNK